MTDAMEAAWLKYRRHIETMAKQIIDKPDNFFARLLADMDTALKERERLKIVVLRDDRIPAFGAWMARPGESRRPDEEEVILLNLEAILGDVVYEDGLTADLTVEDRRVMLVGTLMHEFGHALEQAFDLSFDEGRLEKIIGSYHYQRGGNHE